MTDSQLSRNTYSDRAAHGTGIPAAAEKISDAAWLRAILEFERALAEAAADVSLIDGETRAAALSVIDTTELDLGAIAAASAAGANPAIPIVAELKRRAEEQGLSTAGIHVGATSQDAIDTAIVLCLRRAASHILSRTTEIERILRALAVTHRTTPIMGRTLGQQALPTTFGLVAATWLQIGSHA
ncbi:MAG TPA: lyase family protein, partial [Corynebacterium sp.]|nr:lyase family protein [Corynebacterium sp.]